jgi:polyhydroxyalkanoate synthesis repressor PhaR
MERKTNGREHFRRITVPTEDQTTASTAAQAEPVQIVRYPNRRFYDSSHGRYVTLQDIVTMVREGNTVSVRDSKTNDDLTNAVLTQIILEHHPERMELLPVPILHLMLRSNGAVLEMLGAYMRQSLGYLEFWQRASAFNPLTASTEWMKSLLPPQDVDRGNQPPAAPSPISSEGKEKRAEIDAETLVQRIAEMERRLNALTSEANKSKGDAKPDSGPGKKGNRRT